MKMLSITTLPATSMTAETAIPPITFNLVLMLIITILLIICVLMMAVLILILCCHAHNRPKKTVIQDVVITKPTHRNEKASTEKKLATYIEPDPDAPDLPPRLELMEEETEVGRRGFYDIIRADCGINKEPLPLLPIQQFKGEETEMGRNGVYDVIPADYHQESSMDKKASTFPLSQECKERGTELARDGLYDTIPADYQESSGSSVPSSRQREHLTEMGKNGVYDIIPEAYSLKSSRLKKEPLPREETQESGHESKAASHEIISKSDNFDVHIPADETNLHIEKDRT